MQQHPWVEVDEQTATVRELDEPVAVEPDRSGEGDRPCGACGAASDELEVYRDELWRIRVLPNRPFPGTCLLMPLRHVDGVRGLDARELASYGPTLARIETALLSLPPAVSFRQSRVARVHSHLWNDGGSHLHQWFFPRPYGYLQMLGSTLVEWEETLPPASADQTAVVVQALRGLLS